MKYLILGPLVMAVSALFTSFAVAEPVIFQTESARLQIEDNGIVSSLTDKQSNREELNPTRQPIATVTVGGHEIPATSFSCKVDHCQVVFGASGVFADYRVTTTSDYFLFELVAFHGDGIDKLTFLQLSTSLPTSGGELLAVRWNDSFAISLIGLTPDVETAIAGPRLSASIYPQFGILNRRVVLIAQSPPKFLNVMARIEQDFKMISPPSMIDGVWAKSSSAASSNYLFTDLNEANVDDILRYARAGHMPYVLILAGTWSSSFGSYPINRANYPRGEAGLKAVVDKLHAAGIRVGLHLLTDEVSKTDAWVRPSPDPGLLKTGKALLAQPMNPLQGNFSISHLSDDPPTTASDLQIDKEIIHCAHIAGDSFSECQRGYSGTVSAPHSAGAAVSLLADADNAYLADLRSNLVDRISTRISGLINSVGFDMVDFDGGELNSQNGPSWYWVGLQQYDIWKRVHRDLLVQGSGITPWSWHFFTRGISDDFAAVGVKENFQREKIDYAWNLNHQAFLPAEVGWVGLLGSTPDHPATMPDEMELFAARGAALNSAVGLEASDRELNGNGRSTEMLQILAAWQEVRKSGLITPKIRSLLSSGEWHLTPDGKIHPAVYYQRHLSLDSESLVIQSSFPSQPLRFRLRASTATNFPKGVPETQLLNTNISLTPPSSGAKMPGALIRQITFAHPLDLTNQRNIAVRASIQGLIPTSLPAVLNIQLRDTSGNLRDYYLDLDSNGSKLVEISPQGASRMLADFWPDWSNYHFKSAIRDFNYSSVASIALRWMRYPVGSHLDCSIEAISSLKEEPALLENVEISSGTNTFRIPGELQTGDYAEYLAEGEIHIYDRNNFLLRTVHVPPGLQLNSGDTSIHVRASGNGTVDFTVMTFGQSVN